MVCEEIVDHTVYTMLVAYVDMDTQHSLREGMEAQVWPKGEERDEIGYVRGVITSIDRYPTPREEYHQPVGERSETVRTHLAGGAALSTHSRCRARRHTAATISDRE